MKNCEDMCTNPHEFGGRQYEAVRFATKALRYGTTCEEWEDLSTIYVRCFTEGYETDTVFDGTVRFWRQVYIAVVVTSYSHLVVGIHAVRIVFGHMFWIIFGPLWALFSCGLVDWTWQDRGDPTRDPKWWTFDSLEQSLDSLWTSTGMPPRKRKAGNKWTRQVRKTVVARDPQPDAQVSDEEVIELNGQPDTPPPPEDVENVNVEDVAEEPRSPEAKSTRKSRKRIDSYLFTEKQELDIASWWQSKEMLYVKRLNAYKNTPLKEKLVTEMAQSLDPPCTCEYLTYAFHPKL